MILNFADNIKIGTSQVQSVYSGSTLIWPTSAANLWTFNDSPGAQIAGLNIIFTGSTDINWGDSTTNTLTSNVPINHTY
jgi:hypothetical protein